MKARVNNVLGNVWKFSLSLALITALVLTTVFTVWNWIENPGEIFHGSQGTQWSYVFDTAKSWFVPTFLTVFIGTSIAHIAYTELRIKLKK